MTQLNVYYYDHVRNCDIFCYGFKNRHFKRIYKYIQRKWGRERAKIYLIKKQRNIKRWLTSYPSSHFVVQ